MVAYKKEFIVSNVLAYIVHNFFNTQKVVVQQKYLNLLSTIPDSIEILYTVTNMIFFGYTVPMNPPTKLS